MSEPVLRLSGVRKRFGETEVLRGIDLEVQRHEVVALIGASGSGKSTLLRTVNLLEQVDDGQVFLGGQDISDPRVDAGDSRVDAGDGAAEPGVEGGDLRPERVLHPIDAAAELGPRPVVRPEHGREQRDAHAEHRAELDHRVERHLHHHPFTVSHHGGARQQLRSVEGAAAGATAVGGGPGRRGGLWVARAKMGR